MAFQFDWDDPVKRSYEVGIDRGVLYLESGDAVPWYGLRGVTIDDNVNVNFETYYVDGEEYLTVTGRGEFQGTLKAFTSHEEFDRCTGMANLYRGTSVAGQNRERFGLSYRTFVGNADGGTRSDYKLHLCYNVLAIPSAVDYASISAAPDLADLTWDLWASPVAVPGKQPTAHMIVDTRYLYHSAVEALEGILYGSGSTQPRLPSPTEVIELLELSAGLRIIDNDDGTWTAISDVDGVITQLPNGLFTIEWPTAMYTSPDTYYVSSM